MFILSHDYFNLEFPFKAVTASHDTQPGSEVGLFLNTHGTVSYYDKSIQLIN